LWQTVPSVNHATGENVIMYVKMASNFLNLCSMTLGGGNWTEGEELIEGNK